MAPKEEREKTQRERMSDMEKKIDRMYTAMIGDEQAGVEGMVQRVKKHGDYIRTDKRLKMWAVSLLAGSNGAFFAYIKTKLGI